MHAVEASMLGSFDRSRELVNRCYQSCGLGIFLLPVVLAAMIGLALAQPDLSNLISEAAQAEFAGTHLSPQSTPSQLAQPAKAVRTVKAN
jgi:hypothetical protein